MNHTVDAIIIFLSLLLIWISSHHHLTLYETWHTLAKIQVHQIHRKVKTLSKRGIR